jgi:hypothetical protein
MSAQWKIWIAKERDGHFVVWDRLTEVERFGPFATEREAMGALDAFTAAAAEMDANPRNLPLDDLPEWAKVG